MITVLLEMYSDASFLKTRKELGRSLEILDIYPAIPASSVPIG
jgi:hypothetical protein